MSARRANRLRGAALALACALALAACGEVEPVAVERVQAGPVTLLLRAEGELASVEPAVLRVPGEQWAPRRLEWMVEDGARVEAGQVVARFSADASRLALSDAEIELMRATLQREGKADELDSVVGRTDVDLAQVQTDLGIARRYAGADLDVFSRNEILNAVQDERFLSAKDETLRWQRGQAGERGAAELAVVDATAQTQRVAAERSRADLAALEVAAPNDGVFRLTANWAGEKPRIGEDQWGGNEFARLPDPSAVRAELSLPQLDAEGLRPGLAVRLRTPGAPDVTLAGTLDWVAPAAQPRARDNPARFVAVRVAVDAAEAAALGWVPGQRVLAEIVLAEEAAAISVPSVALETADGATWLWVGEGDAPERRQVTLGARGAGRAIVLEGLAEGEAVRLRPPAPAAADPDGDPASGDAATPTSATAGAAS